MFSQFRPLVADETAEVGPGIGTFSERLLGAGVERLLLVEPDPALADELERRFGPTAHGAGARLGAGSPALARDAGRFGFVLCQNVLEHVPDDAGAVTELAAALRPGGALGLLVPAHPRLTARSTASTAMSAATPVSGSRA